MQLLPSEADSIPREMDLCLPYPRETRTLGEATMIGTTLDIFRKLPDGQPMWIKAVEGLNEANRQVSELAKLSPGDYFIFDTRTSRVIVESLRAAKVA
jgi:hypothetical protein